MLIAFFSAISIKFAPVIWILLDITSAWALVTIAEYQAKRSDVWGVFKSSDDIKVLSDLSMNNIDDCFYLIFSF